jgi:membrane-bound lytic murein transglycosylase
VVDHPPRTRSGSADGQALSAICKTLRDQPDTDARTFFETHFVPHRVEARGLLTGYFEPQLEASFERTARFRYPLLCSTARSGGAGRAGCRPWHRR